MDAHRVRRIVEILLASQARSGRSSSDPNRWTGRPIVFAVLDAGAFAIALALGSLVAAALSSDRALLTALAESAMPFVPLLASGGVVVAGLLFELTSTSRFSGSDAVNWLPIDPAEYVAASTTAIAYAYSLPVALLLGGLLPLAIAGGVVPAFVLTAALSVTGLYEGGALIEMIRSGLQRVGSQASGRRASLVIVLRAAALVIVFLALNAAFNPILLSDVLRAFGSAPALGAVPIFWSTFSIRSWVAGQPFVGLGYGLLQLAFVGALLYAAAGLRRRYWVPSPGELSQAPARPSDGHRWLGALGLSMPEAALVSKDLRAYVRRRDLLPILILPVVIVLLLELETAFGDPTATLLIVGWISGFFTILIASVSIGQERRSIGWLYAYPLSARNVLRAKAAAVLLPSLGWTMLLAIAVGVKARVPLLALVAMLPVLLAVTTVLGLWGLVFATRYSDFQDRPRPQFLRPVALLAALGSSVPILVALLLPATVAILSPSRLSLPLLASASAVAVVIGATALHWTRTGFERLLREVPV